MAPAWSGLNMQSYAKAVSPWEGRTPVGPLRVLAVDDDPAALALYGDILGRPFPGATEGPDSGFPSFEVSLFDEGADAVDAVRAALAVDRPYAVAFIDLRLANGPDGVWTAAQIRAFDPFINIVIVTAFPEISILDIVRRVPPADRLLYLSKPFQAQEIRQFALALGTKWHSEQLLQAARQCLEARVEERTAELARLNERLRRDIEERHRAETALRESEARLRRQNRVLMELARSEALAGLDLCAALRKIAEAAGDTLEAAHTRIWLLDAGRARLCCRERYDRAVRRHSKDDAVWNGDPAEYLRRLERERTRTIYGAPPSADLLSGDGDDEGHATRLEALVRVGGAAAGVVCFEREGAERLWTADEESFAGSVADFVALVVEAWERRSVDETLRQLQRAVEQSIDGILVTDMEGTVVFANRAWAEMHGFSAGDLRGSTWSRFHTPEQLAEEVHPLLEEVRERGSLDREVGHVRQDGRRMPTRTTLTLLRDDADAPMGYLAIARDITQEKEAEERGARLEEQLRRSQKMEAIGRLAGGVAHDFNNMLMAILGCSDFLLNAIPPDQPLRHDVEEIKRAGERAADLTRQLLAFSRRQVLQPRVIDLNAVVSDMERMLRRIIGEDIELMAVLDADLGRIKADPGRLEQVIINLALNARDAMPRGGRLTLETRNFDLDQDYIRGHALVKSGPYVMLAVSDTGTGIDPETQAHIFEPFFTTKGPGQGTGLGLATVYGTVKQSDGYIWVYSEPDRGTTFKLYFPRVPDPELASSRSAPEVRDLQGRETVLLVEDDPVVRDLIRRILVRYAYRVLEASSGPEALEVCRNHDAPIDLVLTDVVMPQMSGRELIEELVTVRPDLRVLYMSGYSSEAVVRHGMLDKYTPFLQKPFTPDTLARKLREILDNAPENGADSASQPSRPMDFSG